MNEGNGVQSETGQNDSVTETPEPETSAVAVMNETTGAASEPSPAMPEREETGVIRGAFLARRAAEEAASTGGAGQSESDTGVVTLRAAYLAHLSEPPSEAVGGADLAGGNILRGVYVARAVIAPQPATRRLKTAPTRKKAKVGKVTARRGGSAAKKSTRAAKRNGAPVKAAKASARGKTTVRAKASRGAGSKRAKPGRSRGKARR